MTILNENIRYLRYKHNLTQRQLADNAGVSKTCVEHMESHEFINRRKQHYMVSNYFGYDLSHLMNVKLDVYVPTITPRKDLDLIENRLIQAGHCIPTENKFVL